MRIERRDFIRLTLAYSAVTTLSGALASIARGDVTSLPPWASKAPAFLTSLTNFGTKALPNEQSALLNDWTKVVDLAPAPQSAVFSDRFDPSFQIDLKKKPVFVSPTKVAGRLLFVSTLPHIVENQDTQPDQELRLNKREMDELANTQNSLLYHIECECIYRLPLNSGPRREHTQKDWQTFLNSGYYNQATFLRLDYVRDFCRCDGVSLMGFAYFDSRYAEPDGHFARELFSIAQS